MDSDCLRRRLDELDDHSVCSSLNFKSEMNPTQSWALTRLKPCTVLQVRVCKHYERLNSCTPLTLTLNRAAVKRLSACHSISATFPEVAKITGGVLQRRCHSDSAIEPLRSRLRQGKAKFLHTSYVVVKYGYETLSHAVRNSKTLLP
jgi:hypothetical protein